MTDASVLGDITIATDSAAQCDEILTIAELSELGFGHWQTIRKNIDLHDVPYEVLDQRGTIGVRRSNLGHLPRAVRRPRSRTSAEIAPDPRPVGIVLDELGAMVAQLASAWTQASAERRSQLKADIDRAIATASPCA
jgi:hypothetical protein